MSKVGIPIFVWVIFGVVALGRFIYLRRKRFHRIISSYKIPQAIPNYPVPATIEISEIPFFNKAPLSLSTRSDSKVARILVDEEKLQLSKSLVIDEMPPEGHYSIKVASIKQIGLTELEGVIVNRGLAYKIISGNSDLPILIYFLGSKEIDFVSAMAAVGKAPTNRLSYQIQGLQYWIGPRISPDLHDITVLDIFALVALGTLFLFQFL